MTPFDPLRLIESWALCTVPDSYLGAAAWCASDDDPLVFGAMLVADTCLDAAARCQSPVTLRRPLSLKIFISTQASPVSPFVSQHFAAFPCLCNSTQASPSKNEHRKNTRSHSTRTPLQVRAAGPHVAHRGDGERVLYGPCALQAAARLAHGLPPSRLPGARRSVAQHAPFWGAEPGRGDISGGV